MYLVPLKSLIVDALKQVFASGYVDIGLNDGETVNISMEYPLTAQSYPGIWVNYEDEDTLEIGGIDHHEFVYDDPTDPANSPVHEVTRWMFGGEVTLTIVALASLERDNLYDQFVRVFAFGRIEDAPVQFRSLLETNDFIATRVNWDQLRPHGDAASQGTPWGTEDEVIYEKSISFDIEGECVSDPSQNVLVALSQIIIVATSEDDPTQTGYELSVPRAT